MEDDLIGALDRFYSHYDQNKPDKATLEGVAKKYAGNEKAMWEKLYSHYDPEANLGEEQYGKLLAYKNPFATPEVVDQKKKDSLPVSQPQSKTASVGTPKITIEGSKEEIPMGINMDTKAILEANKDKQWVDRIFNAEKYPSLDAGKGQRMTHKLSYAEEDGKFYVFPEVQYDKKTGQLNDYTDREKHGWTAFDKAMKEGETISFNTEAEARAFTEHYKEGTELDSPAPEAKAPVGINTATLTVTGEGGQTQGEITQGVAEEAKQSKRSKLIANTSMALKNLAETTGGDFNIWEKQIGGILNDPKIKSQDERDYKAMQAAYKIFQESGESRNAVTLPDIGMGNVVVNEAMGGNTEMEELWNEKAKVAADFRANDPVGWNDMLQQDKESKYSEIYGVPKGQKPGSMNSPAAALADKQLVNSAFERGITGIEDETELQEANLRNQAIFFDRSVKAMEAMGIDPTPAKEQAAQFWKDAGKVRATRHAELQRRIAEVQKMLEGNIPEFQRKAAKAQLELMQAEDRGFIDPTVKLEKVVAQYATDVKENMEAGDTPYEGLLKYYGNLLFEEKELAAQIGDESTAEGVMRELGGMTFRGWNDDEMRLKALRDKIRSISPVVLLNEMPRKEGATMTGYLKTGNAGDLIRTGLFGVPGMMTDMKPVEDSFLGTVLGQGGTIMGELDTPSAEAKAMDVAEMLTATGLDAEKFVSKPYQEKFKEMEEGPGWFSLTHGKELAGMLAGMGLQAYTGGAILKGTGVGQLGTRMEGLLTMLGQTKKAKAAKVMLDAMTRGAGYEITGDLFKNQEHFFNFTTGMVGGLGEQGVHALGKGAAKWLGKTVNMAFGNQSNQAAKFIAAWNSRNDAMKQWVVNPQTGKTVADVMADRSLSKFLSKGVGGVTGQLAEGGIRQLQEVGGSSDVGGALTGLVSIFRDSDVRKQYVDGLKNQFGGDFDERASFFLDMFFMGAVMGGAHDKGIGREAMKEAQRIHAEMTTEQRAQVDPILDSFGELAKMQGEVEARQRNVETAPPLDRNTVSQPPKDFVEKPMEKVQDALDQTYRPYLAKKEALGENPSKKDLKKIEKEWMAEREKIKKSNPQYMKFEAEMNKIAGEWVTERKKLDPKWEREYDDPIFKDLWEDRRAKEKVVADKYAIKDTVLEAAREDARLRSELEIEGKDLKAEVDPTTKGPEVVEVSPTAELVVEPVAETEVVAEPVVETKPGMKATLEETVADIEQRRQKELSEEGGDIVESRETFEGLGIEGNPITYIVDTMADGSRRVRLLQTANGKTSATILAKVPKGNTFSNVELLENSYGLQEGKSTATDNAPSSKRRDKVNSKYDAELAAAKEHFANSTEPTVVEPPAEAGGSIPPEPPVVNNAAGGGEPPVVEPPLEVGVQPKPPVNSGVPPLPPAPEPVNRTPPSTTEVTTAETTGGGPLRKRSTMETWAREDNKVSKSLTKVLEAAQSYYQRQKHSDLYARAMNLLTGGKETKGENGVSTWDWEDGKQSPFEMIDKVAEGKVRGIDEFADVLAQRQVLMKLVTDSMDSVVKELKTETDPTKIKDLENILDQFDIASNKLAKALNEQGTIGGQGISFLGHFRNMYENPEGMIWNEIAKFNRKRAEEVKNKTQEIANEINDGREQLVQETSDAVANSQEVTETSGKAAKSNTKAKGASSKDSIAKAKDSIAKSREALSKNINSGGKALGLGLVGATLVSAKIGAVAAYHVTKIGVELAKIGAIKFMDWASQMRQELKGVVALSDAELKDIWDTGKIGKESPREISEAALKRASVAAKKMNDRKLTLREQIQKELKASNSNGDLQDRLKQNVGLTSEEAAYVIKHGDAVITATAARVEAREFEAAQKLIDAKADSVQKSRKAQTKQRISRAMESSIKKDGGKNLRESLVSEGFSEAEADAITLEQGADFGKRADEALKRAGDPARPVKVGDPSLRKRMQDVFDSHFSIKNTDSSTLKERLVRDAGLSEAQAETVLKQQAEYISKLEAAVIDKIEAKERQQIAFEHYQDFIARREAVAESVNKAITDYYKDPTGKPIEERLADNGLDPTQVREIMDARATEFAQGAVDAITKAAKEPLPKTKAGEPTIRQKIQTAFNDHFNPKNAGAGITLKERLTKDVGLTEAQADTVLREENQQLSKREQAMVDEVLRREAEATQKAMEAAEKQEQQQIQNNVREAINEHFGRDTMKNKVEDKLAKDAGLPDKSTDKIQIQAGPTKPTVGSKIVENGLDYEYVGESTDGKMLNYERIKTPEEITKREEIAKTAKKVATFGKMKLLNGKNVSKDVLAAKIGEATGLKDQELSDLVDFVHNEANKSFVDRIEEKTGLPHADAERIAQEATKDFEERAKRHVESKVKALGKKPKAEKVHRATTDVDRAMNALLDGELTDEMVNDIFQDRLGFMEQMTPEQAFEVRNLAKALARTESGSILELDAARAMDRAFGQFLPSDTGWAKAGEIFKAWAYANMLNGMTTSAVNVISAAPYIALAPALNIANMSEWGYAVRNAVQAEGGIGTKANVFARSSPVTGAIVKYTAGAKAGKQAFRRASDIFLQGYIDNKFLSAGQQAFGKQMNILERTAYNRLRLSSLKALGLKDFVSGSNYVDAYSWLLKFSGRNLAAQDVFLRTIAHEMQLADAVRKSDAFITRGDMAKMGFTKKDMAAAGYSVPAARNLTYTQWVNFEMSMNNPRFKNAKEMAIQDVKTHEELTGGLTDAQRKRYVDTRMKEIMRFGGTNEETGVKLPGLRLSEKAKEDAESVARSQIFTHARGGVYSMWSGQMARLTSHKAGKIFLPLVPFTTIIGNLSDTMADFNPLTGIARANGISMSELLAEFQRVNNTSNKVIVSAKMGDAAPRFNKNATNPYGQFVSDRIKHVVRENKDAKYYEQMARYWTGVQGFFALSMMVNKNPYSQQGLGLTGSQDDNPYMITWNGEAIWSYKDLPFIAPAATLVAQFNQWEREYPDKKDQSFLDEGGGRLWYALWEAETISSKVSVAEGSMRAMDLVQGTMDLFTPRQNWEDTPETGEKFKKLLEKVSKPYLSFLIKPLPQRASLVEQIGQVFDPSVYSKSDIINSLTYAFTGAAYKLPGIEKIEMVDIYGDPITKMPGEDRMAFLASFKDDISQRPHVKFMNERGIVLAPTQNRAVAWEDQKDILGVSYKDYTTEQFAYFAKTSGEYFKTMLTGGTIRVGERDMEIPGIMNVDPELRNFMDNDIVSYGQKKMTATEKEVRQALSNARSLARDAVKAKFGTSSSSPMLEGSATGGVNNW